MNELAAHPTRALAVLAAAVAAISMLVPVMGKDERIRPGWARPATALAALCILVWCAGTFLVLVRSSLIAPRFVTVVMYLKTWIGGIGAGTLIMLLMSGSLLWSRPKKTVEGQSGAGKQLAKGQTSSSEGTSTDEIKSE